MREAEFLESINAKCTAASVRIPSYASWAEGVSVKQSVAVMLTEVNHQLSYFYGRFTKYWHKASSPYYLFLHQIRYQLEKELAYQRRQTLLSVDEMTDKDRTDMVQYYLKKVLDPVYGLTELTDVQFQKLFKYYYKLERDLDIQSMSEVLFDASHSMSDSWKLRLLDYFYTWSKDDLSVSVKEKIYSKAYFIQQCERVDAELAVGLAQAECLARMSVLSYFSSVDLSDVATLRRAQLIVQLSKLVDVSKQSPHCVALIELCQQRIERERLRNLRSHAFNIGLTSGCIFGVFDKKMLTDGDSPLHIRQVLLGNLMAYIGGLPDDQPFKAHMKIQLQQMQADTESSYSQVSIVPELIAGHFYSLCAGWRSHVLAMVVAKIEGATYLSFANRGGGAGEEPGLHFYKVNNPDALSDIDVIKRIHYHAEDNRDYVLDCSPGGAGIGKDLQLEQVAYIRQKPQRGGRCACVVFNKDVECRMTFLSAVDMVREKKEAGELTHLTKEIVESAHSDAKRIYKQFRQFSRQYSADQLEAGIREVEQSMPTASRRRIAVEGHDELLHGIERYVKRKSSASLINSFSLFQVDGLRQVLIKRRAWLDSCQSENDAGMRLR
ncbi:MAG: hypothetical protein P1U40_11160 [Coxiellaceae bacterium]|nr:hypothetical protein [Coxiellaceae bacterium]